jgi:replicative DNA helicase
MALFADESAEYRLLACTVDEPELVLRLAPALFTSTRVDLYKAMCDAYSHYGELTSEGVERFLGVPISGEIEAARGAKPGAIIDKLVGLATQRQTMQLADQLNRIAASGNTDRAFIGRTIKLEPIMAEEDSSLAPGVAGFTSDLTRKMSGQYRFIKTGMPFLDHMLGGEWPRQALTVVMGPGGGGKCYDGDVWMADGTSKHISQVEAGDRVLSLDEETLRIVPSKVVGRIATGLQDSYAVLTQNGRWTYTSGVHPYLTERRGWVKTLDLIKSDRIATVDPRNNALVWSELVSILPVFDREMWDLEVEGTHNFVGNGVVLHNTALVCQSMVGMGQMESPSLFVSLEMPKARLISRFAANLANVDGRKLRAGTLDQDEYDRVDKAVQYIQTLPLYIVDNPSMTIEQIVYQIKAHKAMYGIEAVFLDYLQIVNRSSAGDNDSLELGHIAQMFRNAAVSEDVAAVALSQQNRQFKGLASILGSGRVGHIADSVFEIELEETANDGQRVCTFNFVKNRDGGVGACTSMYRPKYLRFE